MTSQLTTRRTESCHPNIVSFNVMYGHGQHVSYFGTLYSYRTSYRVELFICHLGGRIGWSDGTVEAVRRLHDESFILRHVQRWGMGGAEGVMAVVSSQALHIGVGN